MKINLKINLKVKLISLFLILISLALIGLGIFSYTSTLNSMQSMTEQSTKELVGKTAEEINQNMESVSKLIQMISGNEALADAAAGNDNAKKEAFRYLSKLQKENDSLIETLVITDDSCKGVLNHKSESIDMDYSDRDYVKSALNGAASKSQVIISKTSGNPVIAIAYPLMKDEKITGVIIGTIKYENITKFVSVLKMGKKGYGYMIDKTGLIVYHPDNKKAFKENLSNTNDTKLKSVLENMKAGKTGQGFYTYNGTYKFVSFMPAGEWIVAVTADYNDYMSDAIKIRNYTIMAVLLAIVISVILAFFFITLNIINPVKKLEELMLKAGDGDLTVNASITTKDEIQTLGEYFNKMIGHQSRVIHHIRDGSGDLASASQNISDSAQEISASAQQIASSMEDVASNAERQNSSIIQTSEVLVQLSSLIQIAQNKALTASKNSKHTMEAAQQGRTNVKETVEAIENINNVSSETEEVLNELNELSKKVNGIIDTINSISAQTNLLSLNAAIEAARAGEHGKGFTVVADEVRKLSVQTNAGANEISSLIKKMILQIDKAVKSMNLSKHAVESGVTIAKETDESFISIINAVEQIANDIEQVVEVTKDEVASSDEIVKIIDTVATTIEKTTQSTEEVSAAVEEQSSAVESLAASSEQTSSMASSLYELIEKFKV